PPGSFKRLLDSSVIGAQPKNGSNCTGPECNDEKQRSVPPTRTHFGARWIRGTLHLGPDREEEHHTGAETEQPGECYHGGASKGTLHALEARLLSNGSRLSCGGLARGAPCCRGVVPARQGSTRR